MPSVKGSWEVVWVQKWGEKLEGGWKDQGRSQGTEERAVDGDSYRGDPEWVWRREAEK